ncbi:MAG: rod shape-determining protein, partial [Patescibacteria group bacterium]
EKGLTMAGGAALLSGIDKAIAESAGMPVTIAEDPLTCVVRGCGKVLENPMLLKRIRIVSGLK